MAAPHEIEILIRAKYPILYVVSWEERRVEEAVQSICTNLGRTLHSWSVTQGMKPPILKGGLPRGGGLPAELEALAQVHDSPEGTVVLLKDFHPYLKDYRVIRLLRDLAARMRGRSQTLVLSCPTLVLPPDLEKEVTVLEFPLPSAVEIGETLDRVTLAVKDNTSLDTSLSAIERERVIKSAQGLTMDEIESVFARSLVEKKRFDLDAILQEKKQIIRKSGLLEYYAPDSNIGDVGGLDLLKEWLDRRTKTFSDEARDFGIPAPKGMLLLGVQGCGKSLVAKAVACHWNLPLLKLDVGRIFGSLVGQSEENIRKAIRTAESVAPCVLWADELEKGFAGSGSSGVSDSGTTARVFATFLTWMSEKTKPVFLIATANDVTALPPEMLRKGRFDEIFFVDLPDGPEREQVFSIHLQKRHRSVDAFNLKALAHATDGFSGAEIEQVVVGALYVAFEEGRDLLQKDLIAEAKAAVPLSVMMREEIDELRTWAEMRTRPASKRKSGKHAPE
jgi:ATP-dependent 26S proteasome regulatory subunit